MDSLDFLDLMEDAKDGRAGEIDRRECIMIKRDKDISKKNKHGGEFEFGVKSR